MMMLNKLKILLFRKKKMRIIYKTKLQKIMNKKIKKMNKKMQKMNKWKMNI